MKSSVSTKIYLSLVTTITLVLYCTAQQPIGGYNAYYGSLHNHTNVSNDAIETPLQAYTYAKEVAGLDFLGLSDHAHAITAEEWVTTQANANQVTENGKFVAFRGFEWSHGNYGHVTVVNSSTYTTRDQTEKFSDLVRWLEGNDAIAFLNHPGRQNGGGNEFHNFNSTPSENIVGIELWNQSRPFTRYYYTDGYNKNDGGLGFFEEAQINGWKIGASGAGDNHGATWGTRNSHRMAVLAKELTPEAIYEALKKRRFYSTTDKNIGLSFKIDNHPMGSVISEGNHTALIEVNDGNNEIFTKVKLFKNGILLTSWNPNSKSASYTYSIPESINNDFYHVKVSQQDGEEAISSPIYISSSALKGKLVSISSQITNGYDDAEEDKNGKVRLTSPDIELVYDGADRGDQTIGLRFTNLNIPKKAWIKNAYIQFTANGSSSTYSLMTIKGENTDNAINFSNSNHNLSNRNTTESKVTWGPFETKWNENENGTNQRTSNIKSIIQEIVNRNGYTNNSAIALLITGIGEKRAYAFEGAQDKSAELFVEYISPSNNQYPEITITNLTDNQNFISESNITIAANAIDNDGSVTEVAFYNGTSLLGKDTTAPYSYTWNTPPIGNYNITAVVTDNNNANTTSASVTISVNENELTTYGVSSRISNISDDAEENTDNHSVSTTSQDIDLIYNQGSNVNQVVGLRFQNLNIPKQASIQSAYIQFWVAKTASGPCTINIYGENTSDSKTFIASNNDISSRTKTQEMIPWNVPNWERWSNGGTKQQSTDVSAIIQEIISSENYTADSAISLILEGKGEIPRVAVSLEGYQNEEREGMAPKLFITYQGISPISQYPITTHQNSLFHNGCTTIVYDASKGNAALKDLSGDIYAHTGVVTNNSSSQSDWQHTTKWLDNNDQYKLTPIGNNKYELKIENIREYYNIPDTEQIIKINFVFRNKDGSIVGKDVFDEDLFIDILNNDGISDCNTLSIDHPKKTQTPNSKIIISPNPNQGEFTLFNYNSNDNTKVTLKIYTLLGQLVYQNTHQIGQSIRLPQLHQNTYLIQIIDKSGNPYKTQKLVLIN